MTLVDFHLAAVLSFLSSFLSLPCFYPLYLLRVDISVIVLGFAEIQWNILELWKGVIMKWTKKEGMGIRGIVENVWEEFTFLVHWLIILKISIEQIDIEKTYCCNYPSFNNFYTKSGFLSSFRNLSSSPSFLKLFHLFIIFSFSFLPPLSSFIFLPSHNCPPLL